MKKFLTSTPLLINGLLLVDLGVLFLWGWVLQQIYGNNVPERQYVVMLIFVLAIGFNSFLFTLLRKEIPRPGLPSYKGWFAVFLGLLGMIIIGLGEIFLIYQYFIYK